MGMMTICNLFARIIVMSLRTQFINEIGLKSPALLGLLILGTKVMSEMFIAYKLTS
jgi:hypothetical protein